jgi:hypothetical protein
MTDHADELATLRARNAHLEDKVAALESEVASFRARERRRVLPGLPHDFAMPTDNELRELAGVVWGEVPALRPSADKREAMMAEVRVAFLAQATLPRRRDEKYDRRDGREIWLVQASAALSRAGLTSIFDTAAFMTAMLAAGDVPYCIDPTRIPCDSFWGFANGDGKPADSSAWRQVLRTRRIRPPLPLPRYTGGDAAPIGIQRQYPGWG